MMENDEDDGPEGMPQGEAAVASWIRSAISRVGKDAANGVARKHKISLVQDKTDGREVTVDSYEYVAGNSVESLAQEIYHRAEVDAYACGGGVYFVKVEGLDARWSIAFDGPNARQAQQTAMQRYSGGPMQPGGYGGGAGQGGGGYGGGMGSGGPMGGGMSGPGGFAPRYPPDNPAVMAFQAFVTETASQREHNARLLELAIGGTADMMKMMKGALGEAHDTIRTFERERRSNIVALEELHSKKFERDLEFKKQVKAEERKDKVLDFFEPLALSVASRFFGGKGVPSEMAPLVNLLTSAFKDMDGERLQKLVTSGILKENEVVALMETLKVLQQIHEEADAKNHGSGMNGSGMQ